MLGRVYFCVLVAAIVSALFSPTASLAQRGRRADARVESEAAPASPAESEARSLFEAGRQAFTDGRFEDALDRFRQAYGMSRRPELLFNIGQAADRLRLDAQALEAFERYLAALPRAANRREVEARVEVLRRAQASRDAERTDSEEPHAAERDDRLGVPTVAMADRSDPSVAPGDENLFAAWWVWTIVGAVVVTAAGVGIGVAASSPPALAPGDVGGVIITLGGAW